MSRSSVDVVIVNWNAGRYLVDAIEPLATAEASDAQVNLVVVDNCSSDGSDKMVAARYPTINVLRNEINEGFARACNQGAATGSAEFILFLNPDASLSLDELGSMLEFMSAPDNASVAVLGPMVKNPAAGIERTCARTPRLHHLLFRALSLHRVLPLNFADFTMREFDHLTSRPVDQVIGACILTRRREFESIGGFDERFFVYFEEVDYCRRIRERGKVVYFRSENTVTHVGNATTSQVKGFRFYLSLRSRMTYAHKWFGLCSALAVDAASLLVEPIIRILYALARGSLKEAKEVASGAQRLWSWRTQSGLTQRLRSRSQIVRAADFGRV